MSATWFRTHAWVVALIGLVLEAAVTLPFALVDAPETSAALAILVVILAAFAFTAGLGVGALDCSSEGDSSGSWGQQAMSRDRASRDHRR